MSKPDPKCCHLSRGAYRRINPYISREEIEERG